MSMFYELMMRKKEETLYPVIKGSLTESPSGVFSGFSSTNYLQLDNVLHETEIVVKFTTSSDITSRQLVISSARLIEISVWDSYIKTWNFQSSQTVSLFSIQANTTYWVKEKITSTTKTFSISTDGINYGNDITLNDNFGSGTNTIKFGTHINNLGYGFLGSIDLNKSYIKIGSTKYKLQAVVGYTIVGSPTITDGVVSGFSSANYLTLNQIYNAKNIMNTEIYIRAKTPSSFSSGFSYIFSNTSGYDSVFSLAVSSGVAFISFMGSNLAGTTLAFSDIYISGNAQNNTWYRFKIKGNNGLWVFEVYDDNGNLLGRNTKDWTNLSLDQNYRIKLICLARVNSGEIDLNETYIKINNKLWFNGQQA